MELKKKTKIGTLIARYKQDDNYPGFWIDIFRKGKHSQPICNIEYDPYKNCIQVVVYGDGNADEPTVVEEISLADYMDN